jgi:small subunit ribosomal protein S16
VIKLRLKRFGKKFEPHYRIIVIKARTKREGRAIEDLGHYAPIQKTCELNNERIKYWLDLGAQPTETVENILIRNKILPAKQYKQVFSHSPKKKSQERKQNKAESTKTKEAKETDAKKEEEAEPNSSN